MTPTDSPKGPSEKAKAWAVENFSVGPQDAHRAAARAFDAGRADMKREVLALIDEVYFPDELGELKRRVEGLE